MKQISSPRSVFMAIFIASLFFGIGNPTPVYSHGMRPMVRKIVNQDAQGISGIQLTRGLAQRLEDGRWQFTCPYFCNKTMYPLVTQATPTSMWVAGNNDFFHLENGVPTPTDRTDLSGGRLRGMATLENRVLALQFVPPASSQLIEIPEEGPATTLKEFETPYKFMTIINNVIYIALGHLDTIQILELELESLEVIRETSWEAPQIAEVLGINPAGGRLFAAARFIDRNSLLALEETASELISSVYQATVPFDDAGTLLAIVDSRLHEVNGSSVTPIETSDDIIYELFHKTPYGDFLSTSQGLFRFKGLGQPLEELFLMDELHPPILDGLSSRDLELCETHWSDMKRDWLLPEEPMVRPLNTPEDSPPHDSQSESPAPSPLTPPPANKPDGGCSQTATSSSLWGWLLAVGVFFRKRRGLESK